MSSLSELYLSKNNQHKVINIVLTELSKDYNINLKIAELRDKIILVMNNLVQKYKVEPNTPTLVQLEKLNELTITNCKNSFASILTPYDDNKNSDVEDTYSKMLKERELITDNTNSTNITTSNNISNIVNNAKLTTITEEPIYNYEIDNNRIQLFSSRLDELKSNRMKFLNDRNKVDLEMIHKNKNDMLGTSSNTITHVNNLPNMPDESMNNIDNVGKLILDKKELADHRYTDYSGNITYNHNMSQFVVCAKDRVWNGTVENNVYSTGLEPYRYRFVISSSNDKGIYLQNRQKNISSIRIVTLLISIAVTTESTDTYFAPYLYIYIPELENRVETSIPSRKYVFCMLSFDGILGRHAKYINFISSNHYNITPLSDLNNITIEILAPSGKLISDIRDNYRIVSMALDNATNPQQIILTLDKYYKSIMFAVNDIVIIRNYGTGAGVVNAFTQYMNNEAGLFIKANPSTDEYLNTIYISVPKEIGSDGRPVTATYFNDVITNIAIYSTMQGYILNSTHQPVLLFEIGKISLENPSINQNTTTIV
jgi:hypothetical protein